MRLYFISILVILVITGCVFKKKPEIEQVEEIKIQNEIIDEFENTNKNEKVVVYATEKEIEEFMKQQNREKTIIEKTTKEKSKPKEINYRTLGTVEIFTYKGKYNTKNFDERKLIEPYYQKKGSLIKIDRIYTSKRGDRYGKITGKNLFISMDDLTKE